MSVTLRVCILKSELDRLRQIEQIHEACVAKTSKSAASKDGSGVTESGDCETNISESDDWAISFVPPLNSTNKFDQRAPLIDPKEILIDRQGILL